jgi:hypothetical protein
VRHGRPKNKLNFPFKCARISEANGSAANCLLNNHRSDALVRVQDLNEVSDCNCANSSTSTGIPRHRILCYEPLDEASESLV